MSTASLLEEISPIFWPDANHNHCLMENLGLLSIACLFPQLKTADRWRAHAMRALERCAVAQLTPFGGQIEGSPHYHNLCMFWFLLAQLVARNSGLSFSAEYSRRIHNSMEYSIHTIRPSGTIVPWGDSDADVSSIVEAGVYSYLALDDPQCLQVLCGFLGMHEVLTRCLDSIWAIPDFDALAAKLEQPATPRPGVAWFKDLKQVAMRTSWDKSALSVFFACRTPTVAGHQHIDPMSFDFCGLGRTLVADPGRFTYREDADRRKYKSPEWHSTLTVDHKPPFEYVNTWEFGPQKEGKIIHMSQGKGVLTADAVQMSDEPAVHKRLVAMVDDVFLLVLDRVTHLQPASSVQIYYHLNSSHALWDAAGHLASAPIKDVNLAVATTSNLQGEIREGTISEAIDVEYTSNRLCLEDTDSRLTDRCYAAVLMPHKAIGQAPQVVNLQAQVTDAGVTCSFTLNNRQYAFFWTDGNLERR